MGRVEAQGRVTDVKADVLGGEPLVAVLGPALAV